MILFVEGKDFDPVFYGEVAARYEREHGYSVEVRRASDLPTSADQRLGGSGGRLHLLCAAALWERYKVKHVHRWKNRKVLAFCIDKDVDDIVGLPDYVPSVIRTRFHSVENHLIPQSNLDDIIENALSLVPGELSKSGLSFGVDWKQQAANLWIDWIVYCLLCIRLEAQGLANYSKPSILNQPLHERTDAALSDAHFERLRTVVAWDRASFNLLRREMQQFVKDLYDEGHFDRVFKGKWYLDILFSTLQASVWSAEARRVGKAGLLACFRARFVLGADDYSYYRVELDRLIGSL